MFAHIIGYNIEPVYTGLQGPWLNIHTGIHTLQVKQEQKQFDIDEPFYMTISLWQVTWYISVDIVTFLFLAC